MHNRRKKALSAWLVNGTLFILCLLWLIPTFGLFISSFRPANDVLQSGWWTVFPHRGWVASSRIALDRNTDLSKPIHVNGRTFTNRELTSGVVVDGQRLIWVNRRQRLIEVDKKAWTSNASFTLENYKVVLGGKTYRIPLPGGGVLTQQGSNLSRSFLNTLTVSVPATIIPLLISSFAAYAFAWMSFPGRKTLFVLVIMLLVVPLQVALIPVLGDFTRLKLNGTFLGIWIAHTGFGLPLATYFMYNYISQLPKDLFESAFMDGASRFTIFSRLILPLSVPALASIGIFQFLWVWNDYLVSLVFIGTQPNMQVLSMRIADMVGSRGNDWHLLTSAAFVSMIVPLLVFFSLQRFFVKGLLGGSVKG